MPDDTSNIILEQFRILRNDIATLRSEMHSGFEALTTRMTGLENSMLLVKRNILLNEENEARQQVTIDELTRRIERIERRLELS